MSKLCSFFQKPFFIVGVGSPLRSDDQAGLLACEELVRNDIACITCEYGLENCLGELERYKPKTLIVIDAAYFKNGKPGDIIIATEDSVEDLEYTVSTHSLPVRSIIRILRDVIGIEEVYFIGIYPKSLEIGTEVSFEVVEAIRILVEEIKKCVSTERRPIEMA